MSKELTGQVSNEQIQKWKDEHKVEKVLTYTVDGRIAYLKPVDRNLYSLAASKVTTSPAKFNETIVQGIWLGGDEAIKNEDEYYFGLIDHVEGMMRKRKGELGEL
jgi:hypothetical protein